MIELNQYIAELCSRAVWSLMAKTRSRAETIQMLHQAHAACYHIAEVGGEVEMARCEWLLSRAYSASEMGGPALLHAQRALELSDGADDATRALALEACARAHTALGQPVDANYCKQEAQLAAARIADGNERAQAFKMIGRLPD